MKARCRAIPRGQNARPLCNVYNKKKRGWQSATACYAFPVNYIFFLPQMAQIAIFERGEAGKAFYLKIP